ncbi:hypothetical protein PIB30_059669 [Stylosanthes scabra]|uniref:Arginine biosynthesis bifunctional protein ArgJ, chloroplastic n=1 Tax=Stylosanthes scabra TaxID=79078 RepID=A0ABU6WN29_9FABA|nr:hypothetical protein [Stylosanthes scabra]
MTRSKYRIGSGFDQAPPFSVAFATSTKPKPIISHLFSHCIFPWQVPFSPRNLRICTVSMSQVSSYIPAAPIFLPEGPWKEIPGGVTAAEGFKAAGMYGGLRAKGGKPDLSLVHVMLMPYLQGEAGYQDMIECVDSLSKLLKVKPEEILVESTGVIGQRIKKGAFLSSLPTLVGSLSIQLKGNSCILADPAAVAITTTDLVSKSVAIETLVGGTKVRVGGMAKGSGMIHPNMATMLGVITTDALVTSDVWRKMVQVAVNRSFNQITVDGDTSTNDTIIALASGLSGLGCISSLDSDEAAQLQACLDAVMQGLAKSIAWDGEGATCLIEVNVAGADSEAEAAKVARSVAASSLEKVRVIELQNFITISIWLKKHLLTYCFVSLLYMVETLIGDALLPQLVILGSLSTRINLGWS